MNKAVAIFQKLVVVWKPEQGREFLHSRWAKIVFRCGYVFQLFNFHRVLVRSLRRFSRKFLLLLSEDLEEEKKLEKELLGEVIRPLAPESASWCIALQKFILPKT